MNRRLTFPQGWWEVFKNMKKEEYIALTKAMFAYFFDGEEKRLSGTPSTYFAIIKPHLDEQGAAEIKTGTITSTGNEGD